MEDHSDSDYQDYLDYQDYPDYITEKEVLDYFYLFKPKSNETLEDIDGGTKERIIEYLTWASKNNHKYILANFVSLFKIKKYNKLKSVEIIDMVKNLKSKTPYSKFKKPLTDDDEKSLTLMGAVCKTGDLFELKKVVPDNIFPRSPVLMGLMEIACENGHKHIMEYLHDEHMCSYYSFHWMEDLLYLACNNDHIDIVELLYEDYISNYPDMTAYGANYKFALCSYDYYKTPPHIVAFLREHPVPEWL